MKTSSHRREEEGGRESKSLTELRKDAYAAWCALKTAQKAHLARDHLQHLTSQLHNSDLAKVIPERLLAELPDFTLIDLCGCDSTMDHLLTSSEALPVDVLVPSAQTTQAAGLTWFQVASYTYSILARCFWPTDLPQDNPLWVLNTHLLTPSLHAKYHSLVLFLQKHCQSFSVSCSLPSLPPSLLQTEDTPSRGRVALSPSPTRPLSHLRASENSITVLWYRPQISSQLLLVETKARMDVTHSKVADEVGAQQNAISEDDRNVKRIDESSPLTDGFPVSDDVILGLFGFNQKAVRPPQLNVTSSTPYVEVFHVCVASTALTELQGKWQDLLLATQGYLESHVTGRPVSRSPSRLRKQVEKTQRLQAGLQVLHTHTHTPLSTPQVLSFLLRIGKID